METSWAGKVANMAPTWLPKWSQDGPKIHQNLDHFLDASWDGFLLMIFDQFFDPKWRQVETKIDQKSMSTSKGDFLKKPCFSLGKTMILRVQGIEVGGKNR